MHCGCCGGWLPPEKSEAWKNSSGECPGSLATRYGQAIDLCGAFSGSDSTDPDDQEIPSGLYFLWPEGSAWIAAKVCDGRISAANESDADTHDAARDSWAGCRPSDDDVEVDAETALALIREVMGDGSNPEMVVVTKSKE